MSKLLDFCSNFDKKDFSAGQDMIAIGEHSKIVYILISGSVDVMVNDTFITNLSEPGTVVGEISALLEIPRTASVKAKEACRAFVISDISNLFDTSIDASLEITRLEFDRLFKAANNLILLKEEFLEAASHAGLDLTKIPQMADYMAQWEKIQESSAGKFPFVTEKAIGEDREITLNPGDTLLKEGDNVEKFYALKSGTVTHSRQDGAFSFDVSQPGTVLNVGYALVNCEAMTTVKAKDSVIIKEIDDVRNLFRTERSAGYEILKQIAEKIVMLTRTFVDMKGKLFGIAESISGEHKEGMKKLTDLLVQREKDLRATLSKAD